MGPSMERLAGFMPFSLTLPVVSDLEDAASTTAPPPGSPLGGGGSLWSVIVTLELAERIG